MTRVAQTIARSYAERMIRSRLDGPPAPKARPRTIEYSIMGGAMIIVGLLAWRALGPMVAEWMKPARSQAVVIVESDECIGGLCAEPAAMASNTK